MKDIKHRILIDFCQYTIDIVFTEDVDSCYRGLLRKFPHLIPSDGTFSAIHTCNYYDYPRRSWVILPMDATVGASAHEICHVVDRMMDYFGFEGTEIRAYAIEFILNKIYE